MQIIPVLDVLSGQAVHGRAGARAQYRPVQSCLAPGSDPLTLARALRDTLPVDTLYLADLDAIVHRQPNFPLYHDLARSGLRLLIDAGVTDVESALRVAQAGPGIDVVVGLETCPDPHCLEAIVAALRPRPPSPHGTILGPPQPSQSVVFSLDLKHGLPLAGPGWHAADPPAIAAHAAAAGVGHIILLDLAAVGMGTGNATLPLLAKLARSHPTLDWTTGGGVRGIDDLRELRRAGVSGVLLASVLHSGQIDADDLRQLARESVHQPAEETQRG